MMRRFNILKWAAYALSILMLAVIQMQAPSYPLIMNVTPLFVIPAVAAIAMLEGETAGGIYGIAAGLFWDSGTGRVFGFNAFFLMCIGIAAGLFVKYLFRNTLLSVFLFTTVFTLTHEFVTWFFFYYMTGSRNIIFAFSHVMLPTAVITLVFAVPVYLFMRMINRRLTSQDGELSA